MKKNLFIITAATLALVSCNEEELVQVPANQVNGVLTVAFEQDGATRTTITSGENNSNKLAWSEGDEIAVFGETAVETAVKYTISDVKNGIFQVANDAIALDDITGVAFPYSGGVSLNGSALTMTLPSEINQTTAGELDLPMWATVSGGDITLKHLAGVLKVNLAGVPEGYNKLTVTADKPISGEFSADISAGNPVLSSESDEEADKTVTVNFNAATNDANDYTLYLPLPVAAESDPYTSIVVSVTDGTNTKVLKQWTNKTVERAKVYSTSADVDTYVTTVDELTDAVAKATDGATINLGADIKLSETLIINQGLTLDLNGHTISTNTTNEEFKYFDGDNEFYCMILVNVKESANDETVTFKNGTIDTGTDKAKNAIYAEGGYNYGSTLYGNKQKNLTFNVVDLQVKHTRTDGNGAAFIFGGGNFNFDTNTEIITSGSNGSIECSVDGTVSINGATITHNNSIAAEDMGFALGVGHGSTINVTDGAISSDKYCLYALPTGGQINVSDGVFSGDMKEHTPYEGKTTEINITGGTFSDASAFDYLKEGASISLGAEITLSQALTIDKQLTLNLNNHTLTGTDTHMLKVAAGVALTVKDGVMSNNVEGKARCIFTQGANVNLSLDGVTLQTKGTSSESQPLIIGGYGNNIVVNIANSTINAGSKGNAITTFNPATVTITSSTISGWSALNIKGEKESLGSEGSSFTIKSTTLTSRNQANEGETNHYATIEIEDNNITVEIDANSTLKAETTNNNSQYIFRLGNSQSTSSITGTKITCNSADLTGTLLGLGANQTGENYFTSNVIKVPASVEVVGWTTTEADGMKQITGKQQ